MLEGDKYKGKKEKVEEGSSRVLKVGSWPGLKLIEKDVH